MIFFFSDFTENSKYEFPSNPTVSCLCHPGQLFTQIYFRNVVRDHPDIQI